MQHVVNIAFDFDDERIKKILEDTTVDKIQKDIKQAIIDELFEKRDWGRNSHADPERDRLSGWARDYIRELISEYKEDICRAAANEIVESMSKSKKWKELIVEAIKEEKQHDSER